MIQQASLALLRVSKSHERCDRREMRYLAAFERCRLGGAQLRPRGGGSVFGAGAEFEPAPFGL